jgi:hypothetical protein
MKLERFALIAEVVSAAAIVVTLIFIVVELRDSTRAQDAATYQEMSRDVQAIFDRLPVQLRVKARAGGEPLNAEEVLEYALYTVMILRIGESWWHQWQLGTVSEEVFRAYISHVHGALNGPVARDVWRRPTRTQFLSGYEAYIDEHIAQTPLR